MEVFSSTVNFMPPLLLSRLPSSLGVGWKVFTGKVYREDRMFSHEAKTEVEKPRSKCYAVSVIQLKIRDTL
jgi:hypothetical protein